MNFRVGNVAFTDPPPYRSTSRAARRARIERRGSLIVHVIHPVIAERDVDELYGTTRPTLDDRPWVGICMIASLDGTTVVDGRSGALGNPTDASVIGALRRAADAVLVGAATVRAEGYGPPKRTSLRIGVVTSKGIDTDSDLFGSGAGFLVMPEDGPADAHGIDIVRAGRGRVDLALAVRRLGEVMRPPAFVQCEGGAHLNGALLASGCVDEIDLTISPVLAGGDGARVTAGAAPTFERLHLAHLATEDGYVYGRWVRREGVSPLSPMPAPPS